MIQWHMSSFLFQNTIIPIQVTLFGMHHYSHVLPTHYNPYSANLVGQARIQGGCFGGCSTPGYESQKRARERETERERERKKERKKRKKERFIAIM